MLSISIAVDEPPIQKIQWNGSTVDAYAGRWIVGIDNAGLTNLAGLTDLATAGGFGVGAAQRSTSLQIDSLLPGHALQSINAWLHAHVGPSITAMRSLGNANNRGLFQFEAPLDTPFALVQSTLSQLSGFQYVEPDFVLSTEQTPNDSLFSTMWGLNNTGQTGGVADADIDAPEAWNLSTGSSDIVVGVIDSGVDYTHPDLVSNIWTNPGEIAGDGIDNDDNGYVDDIHGWDFVNDDNDPMDDNNHGTHVSGTIGATGNNGTGVVGVNWNVRIMALKYLGSTGHGSTSDAVAALNYATMMRRDHGINIRMTSNSWGGGGYSQSLYNAIAASRDQDMLFIAAAGNGDPDGIGDDNDAIPHYPSSYDLDNIIAVAATNASDQRADFSNFGASSVDLGAPGVSVRSTIAGGGYANFNGTSMATPHVAGVAALAWSIAPTASYETIRDAILGGVDPIPALDGVTVTGGRLNALGALQQLGMRVASSSPAAGSVISDLRTSYVVRFSDPYAAGSVTAGALRINGIPADSYTLNSADTITFHFTTTPIGSQGLQTIAVTEGTILRASDNAPLYAYNRTFRYDALPMTVVTTSPASGSIATLPLTTMQFTFNEAFDPTTVSIDDLTLSQGTVTGFSILGNSVSYVIGGLASEGTLSYSLRAGAVADVYGNPQVAHAGSFTLDFGVVPLSTSFSPIVPHAGLSYQSTVNGSIRSASDTDGFTIELLAGQALTVVVDPAAGLRPTIEVRDPSNALIGSIVATAAGRNAVLQTLSAGTSGTYKILVAASASTTGSYSLSVNLNSAVETELHDTTATNNTRGAAQNLNAGFVSIGAGPQFASVVGLTDSETSLLPSEIESNNTTGTANNASYNFASLSSSFYQLSISGAIGSSGDSDWFKLGSLQTTDVISLALSGAGASRGTLANPVLELYRGSTASPTLVTNDDNDGPGSDALIYRLAIPADDTYYVRVRAATGTGTYQLAAWLENGGAAPTTGGSLTSETESNNTAATANNASSSWRGAGYRSRTSGAISSSTDSDFYRFTLTAGDVVTIVADSTSSMDARVALLNAAGTVIAEEDGNSVGPGADSLVYSYRVTTSGTYYVRVQARTGTGAYNSDVYLSTTTAPPVSPINPDWYSFSLTAGQRASLVLSRLGVDYVDLTLVDSNGLDILSGTAGATNADEIIQQFVTPSTGTYYVRVAGTPRTDYRLLLLKNSAFDAEPNHSTDTLVNLTQVGSVVGYLNANRPALDGPVTFTLDHAQSVVTIGGDLVGSPLVERSPGSLTTHYQGTLVAQIQSNRIQFIEGSEITADTQPGTFQPGNLPANYAGIVEFGPSIVASGVFRNLAFDASSGSLIVDPAGRFDANKLSIQIRTGRLDYSIPGIVDGTYPLADLTASNDSSQPATLQEIDGVLYLFVPVESTDSIIDPTTGLQFNLTLAGQLRASLALEPPIDPEDYYKITLAPGESLTVTTQTPFDVSHAAGINQLDPAIALLDGNDQVVASDNNSAADGRNAILHFTSLHGGTYKIRVRSTAGQGEYVLKTSIGPPNQWPVLATIADQVITEGSLLTFSAHATDPDLNPLTYSLAASAPAGASIDPITGMFAWMVGNNLADPVSITVIVTDAGTPHLADSKTFLVTITNLPPTADAGGPYTIYEGEDLSLSGSGGDPVDSLSYSWDLNGDEIFDDATSDSPTLSWAELAALGMDAAPAFYLVQLRVSDGDGGVTTSEPVLLTVVKEEPTLDLTGPEDVSVGEPNLFLLTASDPVNESGEFTYHFDWNSDGIVDQVVTGPSATSVSHTFEDPGPTIVRVSIVDPSNVVRARDAMIVSVAGVVTRENEENSSLTDLVWGGTAGVDHVEFEQVDATTILVRETRRNGEVTNSVETYSDITGRLIVLGSGGDDLLNAAQLSATKVTLDGGAGNNTLYGGQAGDILIGGSDGGEGAQGNNTIIAGNGENTIYGNGSTGAEGSTGGDNLIVGGSGDDTIYGSYSKVTKKNGDISNGAEGGQNLIVGGDGSDRIYASQKIDSKDGGHGSILVAGSTNLNEAALTSIMSEWTSNRDYATRIANISGTGSGPRNNGGHFLQAGATVEDDGVTDFVFSDTDGSENWLFYAPLTDEVTRLKPTEVSAVLD